MSGYVRHVPVGEYRLVDGPTPPLGQFDIELTERCDNDCPHCYICLPENDAEARHLEMSTTHVQSLLAEAASLGAMTVRFTGGEPLLRDDFVEIYRFTRALGLAVILFTNARGITSDIADLLASIPPREPVQVSVYGMSARTYDASTRRPGSFEEFRRGVALLLERGIPFVVKAPLLPGLAGEIAEFEEWATTLPAMKGPPGYSMFFDLRVRRNGLELVSRGRNELIRRMRTSPSDGVRFNTRDRERYLAVMREFCAKYLSLPGDRLFACGAGQTPCVDAYGAIQPCLLLRDPSLAVASVGESAGLTRALTGVFPKLRERRASNPEYLRRCARCFLKSLCAQCPAKSWAETGTLDTPVDYLCEVTHAQACDLGLLERGEYAWDVKNWELRSCGS